MKPGSFVTGTWHKKSDIIKFGRFPFQIEYHYLETDQNQSESSSSYARDEQGKDEQGKFHLSIPVLAASTSLAITVDFLHLTEDQANVLQDLVSSMNDFPSRSHHLSRWYGLRQFFILMPFNQEPITSEDRGKLLLSSASIALSNTSCTIPFFVQLFASNRKFYSGISELPSIRINFDMIHFRETPDKYRYLSELLELYKEKLESPVTMQPVQVSIRFTYVLRDWDSAYIYKKSSEAYQRLSDYDDYHDDFEDLNIGIAHAITAKSNEEPVVELQLGTVWPMLSEEVVVDSRVHTDLDPLLAPRWSLRTIFRENISGLFAEAAMKFCEMAASKEASDELYGQAPVVANIDENMGKVSPLDS